MKKRLYSVLALALSLAMLLSLAACGKQGGEEKPQETPAPEMVYTASFQNLKRDGDMDSLNPRVFTDDGFYATTYTKIGENKPEGAVAEYEGQFDVYGMVLFFVNLDGTVRKLENYQPLEPKENPEGRLGFNSGSDLSGLFLSEDGKLITVDNLYTNWFEGTEAQMESDNSWEYYHNESEYYMRTLESDGTELSRVRLQFDNPDQWLNFYSAQIDGDGNLLCTSDSSLVAFAPDGSLAFTIQSDNWIDTMVRLPDGRVCVTSWGDRGMNLLPVDTQAKTFGEPISLPQEANTPMTGTGDYDIMYNSGSCLYGYKIASEESEKLLNWLDCDVNGDRLNGIHVAEDGTIMGVYNNYTRNSWTSELVTLKKVPSDTLPKKSIITMATLSIWDIQDQVIDFNRHSDSVRIQVTDYSEFNDYENGDYDAGRTKLLTEIMAGNVPDILPLSQMPYTQLAAKGLLEDLYPYIDKDPELKREDFFPNLLKAMEVNGKLCEVASGFQLTTLIGAASVVGDTPGWTYEQLEAALATMPEGCEPLDHYVTRDDILSTLLYLDLDEYVDWTTGKCSFDSPEFVSLLNFVSRFPASFDWDHYEYTDDDSTETRIAQGRQMLTQCGIYSFDDLQYNEMYFNGPVTYIGYPTTNGVGHVVNLSACYAMSSTCKDKDAAWSFLRQFLTKEYQMDQWGLSINLEAYNEKLKEAMTPEYEKDADGNFLLDENGEKIEISRGGWSTEDGEIHNIYALTQAQADQLEQAIRSVDSIMDTNTAIFQIVQEQAAAFFAGQKSAEEVARLIQSRATIYVNEQR